MQSSVRFDGSVLLVTVLDVFMMAYWAYVVAKHARKLRRNILCKYNKCESSYDIERKIRRTPSQLMEDKNTVSWTEDSVNEALTTSDRESYL